MAQLAQQVQRSKRDVFHLQVLVESGRRRLLEAESQLEAARKDGDGLRLEANKLTRQLSLARDDGHELRDKVEASRRDAAQLKDEVASREYMLFKSRTGKYAGCQAWDGGTGSTPTANHVLPLRTAALGEGQGQPAAAGAGLAAAGGDAAGVAQLRAHHGGGPAAAGEAAGCGEAGGAAGAGAGA